ncbi:hypothetical protein EVAR_8646_1 [Eumeta japonica]|uniref:Uncharacterized protein n=1 Tax=Eumeta variegata TaxID=151549 RepID=A0A4C1TUG6_EUMVA|nr:hypothetical protein EVAR_8646_1 [Eumeta japonica]
MRVQYNARNAAAVKLVTKATRWRKNWHAGDKKEVSGNNKPAQYIIRRQFREAKFPCRAFGRPSRAPSTASMIADLRVMKCAPNTRNPFIILLHITIHQLGAAAAPPALFYSFYLDAIGHRSI